MRHLSVAAESWDAQGRPESELYRGTRQVRSAEWSTRTRPVLTDAEEDFLTASGALADREQRATEDQVKRERRVNRRLRAGLVATVVLALVATTAGVLASAASRRADAAAVAADARRLGAEALRSKDLDTALLLSVAGVSLDDSSDTRANLLASLERAPTLVHLARTPRIISLALNQRSGLLFAQAPEEGLIVRRADTLAPVAVHRELRGRACSLPPTGRWQSSRRCPTWSTAAPSPRSSCSTPTARWPRTSSAASPRAGMPSRTPPSVPTPDGSR